MIPLRLGAEWWAEPMEEPADGSTAVYQVDPDVVTRWRKARQEYLAARAALLGQVERQGWRAPAGNYVDVVFTAAPGGPEDPPAVFIELENDERRSVQYGEWIERDDGYWVMRIPVA